MQKGFGRLVYVDALAALEPSTEGESLAAAAAAVDAEAVGGAAAVPVALLAVDYETSLEDRALEGALRQASAADFAAKMHASSFASKEVRGARLLKRCASWGCCLRAQAALLRPRLTCPTGFGAILAAATAGRWATATRAPCS